MINEQICSDHQWADDGLVVAATALSCGSVPLETYHMAICQLRMLAAANRL